MSPGATVTANPNEVTYAHLIDPNRKWYNNRRLITLNAWIVLLLITSSTNGYDGSMMNGLQSLTAWESAFNHPSGGKLGLLNAIQNIGSLAGYPFAPYLSDGIGRRPTVFIGAFIMCVGAAIQTAAQSVGMFIGARFLLGFGLTFAANAAPMLVTEISYPLYRAPLTSAYGSLWYLGAIIAAWVCYATELKLTNSWSWRIPSVIQALPSVLQVFLVFFAPESPRFLVSKGRDAEALKTLAYYHADGNQDDPLVRYEFEEIKTAIEADRAAAAVGWLTLIKTPGNRKRMRIIIALAFFSQWSGNGLVSYYLNKVFNTIGITSSSIQLLINGILQIWNLFWALLAAFMVERVGRRFLFLTSTCGMLVAFTVQTVCSAQYALYGSQAAAHAVIAFVFIFEGFFNIALTPLIISYTIEILPFQLRAKGVMVLNFAASLSLIFSQYVNPIAFSNIAWKYYIFYCGWVAFELVFCYLFIVETKNRTLEETAALFDGENAANNLVGTAALHAGVTEEVSAAPLASGIPASEIHEQGSLEKV